MIFVGIDWSERHHDVCVVDAEASRWERTGCPRASRVSMLHRILAEQAEEPEEVIVGIETDRGLLVGLGGRRLSGVRDQPAVGGSYRDRHTTSGAKSDPGDAKVLADIVRTDRHNHRPASDSELAEGIKLLARTHQSFIWERQRLVNRLRSGLREFYPAALEASDTALASTDAIAVLTIAPTPELGRRLSRSKITAALRRGGRKRNIETPGTLP